MRLSSAQRQTLRAGSILLMLCGVGLAVFAALYSPQSTGAGDLTVVDDPTSFELPDPGLFGGEVIVYGAGTGDQSPRDLGCRLLGRSGDEQSSAKMSELAVLTVDPATVDGRRLEPLFAVRSYPQGATISCSQGGSVAPIAITDESTFGRLGPLVRGFAGGLALVCLVVGLTVWFVFRAPQRDVPPPAFPS